MTDIDQQNTAADTMEANSVVATAKPFLQRFLALGQH